MTREEIADEIVSANRGMHSRELADAVRALPVLATCGECGWHREERLGHFCTHATADETQESLRVSRDDVPPSWCPLRGKR